MAVNCLLNNIHPAICCLESWWLEEVHFLLNVTWKVVQTVNITVTESFCTRMMCYTDSCTMPSWIHLLCFFLQTQVLISHMVTMMGKMPHIYPEPERFLPERWKRENKETLPNVFSFLSFGFGVRMCVGEEVAQTAHRNRYTAKCVYVCMWVKFSFLPFGFEVYLCAEIVHAYTKKRGPCHIHKKLSFLMLWQWHYWVTGIAIPNEAIEKTLTIPYLMNSWWKRISRHTYRYIQYHRTGLDCNSCKL